MKQGWEIKKLKDVCAKITDGTHQTPKYFNEGFIFLSSRNVTSGKIDWDDVKFIDEKQHKEMHKRVAPKIGDILLAKNGTTGVAAMVDRNVVFDIYVSLAHLSPLKTISPFYLLYFINSPLAKNQFNKRLKGAGVPNLHLEEIREVEIPVPPLPEQQRIVSILDEAFAAIAKAKANAEQNLKNAKELFENYLQGVFENPNNNWEKKKLGDICGFVRGPFGGSLKKSIFKPEGYAVYEQQHAIYDQFDDLRYFIDEKKFNEMKRFELSTGDLIMSCSGTMGKIAIVPENIKRGIINQALLKLSPSKKVSNVFLKLWMQSESFQKSLKEYAGGAAIQNVASVAILKNIEIPLPDTSTQNKIVQKIQSFSSETKKLEAIYQTKINDLEELKKSVLQKAFKGELNTAKVIAA